ncbi:hypothetical protein BKA56DRAFT_605951 [Ilyonectria sp. MPI-CAGE-AT-0026]|nr:hypothetical protein BKA56DRAFT_605951 [Ilyonectria sp. MPI-CAGE-AT-0026]
MAKATKDASGKEIYSVIAKTLNQLAPMLDVSWTDEYQIQATTIVFNKGAKIEGYKHRSAQKGHSI